MNTIELTKTATTVTGYMVPGDDMTSVGFAAHFLLSEPLEGYTHIKAYAFEDRLDGKRVVILGAENGGSSTRWISLSCPAKGTTSIKEALNGLGYEVVR